MKLPKEMTNEELEQEYLQYFDMVENSGCFGTKDLRIFYDLENEIYNRNGDIYTKRVVEFPEDEEEEEKPIHFVGDSCPNCQYEFKEGD